MRKQGKKQKGSMKVVLDFMSKYIRVKDENSLSLSSLKILKYYAVLEQLIEFAPSISDFEKSSLIKKSIYDSIKNEKLNEASFRKNFNKHQAELLKKSTDSYRVITQFNFSSGLLQKDITFTLLDTKVKLLQCLPKIYQRERKIQEESVETGQGIKSPAQNTYCICYVQARSAEEAYFKAIQKIDVVRAALNFSYNLKRDHIFRSYGPENYILSGPAHSVHNDSGRAYGKLTHYEPEFKSTYKRITNPSKFGLLIDNTNHVIKQVNTLKLGSWIAKGLNMYVEALDEANPKRSFIMLWSVIDYFTVTIDNHSDSAKKASSIWKDHELVKNILVILREARNDFVHGGVSSKSGSDYLEILRGIIDELILFIINHKEEFPDTKTLEQYLKLPSTDVDLRRKLKEIEHETGMINQKLSNFFESE